jgi:hypothetical protein
MPGIVRAEGDGQTLRMVIYLCNSLFYHIGIELLGSAIHHDGFDFLEVILPTAVQGAIRCS